MPQISFCCVTTDKKMTRNVLGPPGRAEREYTKTLSDAGGKEHLKPYLI